LAGRLLSHKCPWCGKKRQNNAPGKPLESIALGKPTATAGQDGIRPSAARNPRDTETKLKQIEPGGVRKSPEPPGDPGNSRREDVETIFAFANGDLDGRPDQEKGENNIFLEKRGRPTSVCSRGRAAPTLEQGLVRVSEQARAPGRDKSKEV